MLISYVFLQHAEYGKHNTIQENEDIEDQQAVEDTTPHSSLTGNAKGMSASRTDSTSTGRGCKRSV